MQSRNHTALKGYAIIMLKDMGYEDSEIHEEYTIKTSEMKEGFRVDVVGIKPSRKVAIECGLTKSDKLAWLNLFFDEVIVLPFFKMDTENGVLERRVHELEERLKEKTISFDDLKKTYEENLNSKFDEPNRMINALVTAIISLVEGKPKLHFGYDYWLQSALDSLFQSCINWQEAYKRKEDKSNA